MGEPILVCQLSPCSWPWTSSLAPKGSTLALRIAGWRSTRGLQSPFFSLLAAFPFVGSIASTLSSQHVPPTSPSAPRLRRPTVIILPVFFPLSPFFPFPSPPALPPSSLESVAPVDLWKHQHRRRVHSPRVPSIHTGLHCPRLARLASPSALCLSVPLSTAVSWINSPRRIPTARDSRQAEIRDTIREARFPPNPSCRCDVDLYVV